MIGSGGVTAFERERERERVRFSVMSTKLIRWDSGVTGSVWSRGSGFGVCARPVFVTRRMELVQVDDIPSPWREDRWLVSHSLLIRACARKFLDVHRVLYFDVPRPVVIGWKTVKGMV